MTPRNPLLACCAVALLAAAYTGSAAAAPDVQPGLWEVTVKTEMAGMPMAIPPLSHRYCLTKKDLVPNSSPQPGDTCRMRDQKTSGNTVTWRVECNKNGHRSTGTGEIEFNRTSYRGHMTFHVDADGQVMEMTQTMDGHRIGDCR